ncbi:MAG: choice-of-anchor D domain-containing protein [Candidatus Dormibacteraeota bacterium]|nr:choice-of-anchor D domain-containing protein [Candidatus Dormibacteraeota bacterium]
MTEREGVGAIFRDRRKRAIAGACATVAVLGMAAGVLVGPVRGGSGRSPAPLSRVSARVSDATTSAPAPTSDGTPEATAAPTSSPAADQTGLGGGSATAAPAPVPAASLEATALDFGAENVGESNGIHFLHLANPGGPALRVRSITTSADSFQLDEGACSGETLQSGQTCPIGIRFTPTAAGPLTATLTVTDDASPPTQTVRLSGTGTAAAASIDPTSIAFSGSSTGPVTVTMRSTGTGNLDVLDMVVTGPTPHFAISANTCISGHAPGTRCTFEVNATPPIGAAAYRATLVIYDDAGGGSQSIALSWAPGTTTTTTTSSSTT